MDDRILKALMPSLADRVRGRYKAVEPYDLQVIDSRDQGMGDTRKVEFYPPEERDNPNPGKPTVEVFDPSFKGEALEDIIAADFLHYMGKKDPHVSLLRDQFKKSMTPEQQEIDQRAYKRAVSGEFGHPESRPYDQWHDVHRLDQYIGSPFLPEGPNRDDWMGGMSEAQLKILDSLKGYMKTGRAR